MSRAKLLFLPGLLETQDAFREVIEGLEGSIDCVVADLTGSDTITGLAQFALKQAPAGLFLLAGHSMGGYVALEIMRRAPDRVSRLALINTHARPDSPEATENRRRLIALADTGFAEGTRSLLPRLVLAKHLEDKALVARIEAMAAAIGPAAFKRQELAIISRIDSRPHLKDIRVPTLVIAARGDQLMPVEILQELAGGIPGARLAIIEDSGHMASMEQPAAVLELLRQWVLA